MALYAPRQMRDDEGATAETHTATCGLWKRGETRAMALRAGEAAVAREREEHARVGGDGGEPAEPHGAHDHPDQRVAQARAQGGAQDVDERVVGARRRRGDRRWRA